MVGGRLGTVRVVVGWWVEDMCVCVCVCVCVLLFWVLWPCLLLGLL